MIILKREDIKRKQEVKNNFFVAHGLFVGKTAY